MGNAVEVLLQDVKPECQLAEDIGDENGKCLLSAGTVMTDELIALLQRRGVKSLKINQKNKLSIEDITALKSQIEQELANQFRHIANDPEMEKFRQLVYNFRIQQIT